MIRTKCGSWNSTTEWCLFIVSTRRCSPVWLCHLESLQNKHNAHRQRFLPPPLHFNSPLCISCSEHSVSSSSIYGQHICYWCQVCSSLLLLFGNLNTSRGSLQLYYFWNSCGAAKERTIWRMTAMCHQAVRFIGVSKAPIFVSVNELKAFLNMA